MKVIRCTLNGDPVETSIPPENTLIQTLRDRLGLTGTKQGCDPGDCSLCIVLLNGELADPGIMAADGAQGHEAVTVERLPRRKRRHPGQSAFHKEGAVQCGFPIRGDKS